MKKAALMLLFLSTLAIPAQAENLLKNIGFENGSTNWTSFGGPTYMTTEQKRTASYSASKFVDAFNNQDYWSQIYQDVPLLENEPVYGRMYIRTAFSPESSERAGLMIQYLDSQNKVLGQTLNSTRIGGTQTDWRFVEVSAKSAPAGTAKARLSGFITAKKDDALALYKKAYFDDVRLDKIYVAPKLNYAEFPILNWDFENGLNDWTNVGAPVALEKTVKYAGNYSAAMRVDSVATDYYSEISQEFAGGGLTYSFTVKTNFKPNSQAVAGFKIDFLDKKNKVVSTATFPVTGKTDWIKNDRFAGPIPLVVKIRCTYFLSVPQGDIASIGGAAYFDNLQVAAFSAVSE